MCWEYLCFQWQFGDVGKRLAASEDVTSICGGWITQSSRNWKRQSSAGRNDNRRLLSLFAQIETVTFLQVIHQTVAAIATARGCLWAIIPSEIFSSNSTYRLKIHCEAISPAMLADLRAARKISPLVAAGSLESDTDKREIFWDGSWWIFKQHQLWCRSVTTTVARELVSCDVDHHDTRARNARKDVQTIFSLSCKDQQDVNRILKASRPTYFVQGSSWHHQVTKNTQGSKQEEWQCLCQHLAAVCEVVKRDVSSFQLISLQVFVTRSTRSLVTDVPWQRRIATRCGYFFPEGLVRITATETRRTIFAWQPEEHLSGSEVVLTKALQWPLLGTSPFHEPERKRFRVINPLQAALGKASIRQIHNSSRPNEERKEVLVVISFADSQVTICAQVVGLDQDVRKLLANKRK